MNDPYQKCYHDNWDEGRCSHQRHCSMEDRCKRWQWEDCYKENYEKSSLCNGCPTLPACQDKKKGGMMGSRQSLALLIIGMSEAMRLRK